MITLYGYRVINRVGTHGLSIYTNVRKTPSYDPPRSYPPGYGCRDRRMSSLVKRMTRSIRPARSSQGGRSRARRQHSSRFRPGKDRGPPAHSGMQPAAHAAAYCAQMRLAAKSCLQSRPGGPLRLRPFSLRPLESAPSSPTPIPYRIAERHPEHNRDSVLSVLTTIVPGASPP